MTNEEILQQYLMENKTVIFYIEFKKLYDRFCGSLYYDYEKNYGYSVEKCKKQRRNDCMDVLKDIVYLIWSNLDVLEKFPKEEIYMVFNCVRLARSEKMKDAIELSNEGNYRLLEENYTNLR